MYSTIKNILILLFFPLFLFSQRSGLLPSESGRDVTLVAGTGLTLTKTDSETIVITGKGLITSDTNDYKINSSITIEYDDTSGWDTTITLPHPILKEGWYIQNADRVGTYNKDGKIIWGTSEPVYQGPSLYPDGWLDTISPTITWGKGSLVNEPITITDESQGILSIGDGGMIITSPVHEITLPYITRSRSTNPYVNTLDVEQVPSLRYIGTQKIYTSDWKVETGWKTVCDGKNISCIDHQWLNVSEQAGDYNTNKFEIGLSKGDMLQECRVCTKCKRVETQLTFIGNGTNPFVWEATLMIYKQILETSNKK